MGEGKSRFACLAFNFALPIVARDNPTTRDNNNRGSSAKTPIKNFFSFLLSLLYAASFRLSRLFSLCLSYVFLFGPLFVFVF